MQAPHGSLHNKNNTAIHLITTGCRYACCILCSINSHIFAHVRTVRTGIALLSIVGLTEAVRMVLASTALDITESHSIPFTTISLMSVRSSRGTLSIRFVLFRTSNINRQPLQPL